MWDPSYVDALVLRDRDADGASANGLEERLYAVHDANYDVTALVDTAGQVAERYAYDPYGTRTVLDADRTPDADGESDYGFRYGHQGGRHDLLAGLVHFRHRDLKSSLGRWTRQDPAGYVDGMSLYQTTLSSLLGRVDPAGLDSAPVGPLTPYLDNPCPAECDKVRDDRRIQPPKDVFGPWESDYIHLNRYIADYFWEPVDSGGPYDCGVDIASSYAFTLGDDDDVAIGIGITLGFLSISANGNPAGPNYKVFPINHQIPDDKYGMYFVYSLQYAIWLESAAFGSIGSALLHYGATNRIAAVVCECPCPGCND